MMINSASLSDNLKISEKVDFNEKDVHPQQNLNNKNKEYWAESIADNFIDKVLNYFPNYKAAVLADKHGFLIASKKTGDLKDLDDNLLALQTISQRNILNLKKTQKFKKKINDNVHLMIVAKRSKFNLANYKRLEKILKQYMSRQLVL
ncbi:MAG: hypothetical protein ACTSU2_08090 [Promethearchaeota archaeon]